MMNNVGHLPRIQGKREKQAVYKTAYGTIFIALTRTRGCIMTQQDSVPGDLYSHTKQKNHSIPPLCKYPVPQEKDGSMMW